MRDDRASMRQVLELARTQADPDGDVPVAALLEIDGMEFVAVNERERRPDPTAHAEILVLRAAAERLNRWRLNEATVYISKEPCVMCAGALSAARVGRAVFGAYDERAGAAGSAFDVFSLAGLGQRVEVVGGILELEAQELLTTFFRHRRRGGGSQRSSS